MRTTSSMVYRNYLRDLARVTDNMNKTHSSITTGRRVDRPSDDPTATLKIIKMQSALSELSSYDRSITHSKAWLDTTEQALADVNNALIRVKELAIRGASGALSVGSRKALADETRVIADHLMQAANTDVGGRHVFSGFQTDTEPFAYVAGSVVYQGDTGIMNRQIGFGQEIEINATGDKVFYDGAEDLFTMVSDTADAIEAGDTSTVSNTLIGRINVFADQISATRAVVGARLNRLALAQSRISEMEISFESVLSREKDVDIAGAITRFAAVEASHRTILAVGSKLVQPSLVDYIT